MIIKNYVYENEELEGAGINPAVETSETTEVQGDGLSKEILNALTQPDGTLEAPEAVTADGQPILEGFDSLKTEVSTEEAETLPGGTTEKDSETENTNLQTGVDNSGSVEVAPVWDYVKSRINVIDPNWDIPNEVKTGKAADGTQLTPEQINDFLVNTIIEHTDTGEQTLDDPFMKEYVDAKSQSDFDLNKWLGDRSSKMSFMDQAPDVFMKNYLKANYGKTEKNPSGWDDSKIEEYVENMKNHGTIELDAMRYKREVQQALDKQSLKDNEQRQRQREFEYEESEKKRSTTIESLIEKKKSQKDVWGIEMGEAKKKQFETDLVKMLAIDKETGTHSIHDAMMNDETLYDIAYMLWLKDKGMRSYITGIKEAAKDDVFAKTDLKPERVEGRITTPTAINPELFKQPG